MYFQRCHTDVLSFLAEQNKNVRTQNIKCSQSYTQRVLYLDVMNILYTAY